ncbi:hypothetical protein G6O69_11750 [Pseudenhygromyxa sp. WMMC2535]|uniref:hypothetical protein n=1 Tax=Pseudenhygromyxa sp. WMMC2535 TaxID=2712867 RepID=UPI001595025D|nr:hypothetical protein [Pseudenhygromyxa sp. WMMC2535]NVB38505.1 hypothetical protein [Pseudenhygromyxa sp. WMMC2535]
MNSMSRASLVLACLASSSLALAACSDDGAGESSDDTGTGADEVDTSGESTGEGTTGEDTSDTTSADTSSESTDSDDTSSEDDTTDTGGGELPACAGYFPADAVWCRDVTEAATTADSDTVIAWLEEAGWGNGDKFQIDFSIKTLEADADTPRVAFATNNAFWTPDCDWAEMPIPEGGAIEGNEGYACENNGDCHLLVAARDEGILYEMFRANIVDGEFDGGCLAIWDMNQVYDDDGRGQGCTSADAAGFPMAPLLFDADEVASGSIDHAIRFILPNDNIRHHMYSAPATHSTNATDGPDQAPPYGVHLRLRADYPVDTLPSEGAKVVARALQKYGMFLADGGQIALTAESDQFTENKWDGLLTPHDLLDLRPMDFAVIDHGELMDWGEVDCSRTPIGTPP